MQSISRRAQGKGKLRGRCIFCKARRRDARNGPVGCEPHRSARQQCAADLFDALRFQHGTVLVSGPFIHRKHTVCIRGSGNDRHRAAHSSQSPRQLVGPAQMAGENGHRKASALVQHHHRRVRRLAFAVGRNGPHRNAHRAHKNKGIPVCKLPGRPVRKARLPGLMAAAGHAAGIFCGQLFGQRKALCRKGKVGPGHWSVPLRNSVVKAGSYSLLRS